MSSFVACQSGTACAQRAVTSIIVKRFPVPCQPVYRDWKSSVRPKADRAEQHMAQSLHASLKASASQRAPLQAETAGGRVIDITGMHRSMVDTTGDC